MQPIDTISDFEFIKANPIKIKKNLQYLDFSFTKSYTMLPCIQKPENIPDPLNKKGNYKAVINQIKNKYSKLIDCPIVMIKKINATNKYQLSNTRKALYYKALYQQLSTDLTYDNMYRKYFEFKNLDEYTLDEKIFINKCMNNKTPLNQLYKREYINYSLH